MKTFTIVETCTYQVEADSDKEALEKFLQADNPNDFLTEVTDRAVTETEL